MTNNEKAKYRIEAIQAALRDKDKGKLFDLVSPEDDKKHLFPDWEETDSELADQWDELLDEALDLIL